MQRSHHERLPRCPKEMGPPCTPDMEKWYKGFMQQVPTSTKASNTRCLEGKRMPQIKTWKTRPDYFVILEILKKKGDMTDDDLFTQLRGEFEDLGFKDFNDLLLKLEVTRQNPHFVSGAWKTPNRTRPITTVTMTRNDPDRQTPHQTP